MNTDRLMVSVPLLVNHAVSSRSFYFYLYNIFKDYNKNLNTVNILIKSKNKMITELSPSLS